jgi:hypothetical protein
MYVLNFAETWGRALYEFAKTLKDELGEELLMIIGLDENDLIYDSNVLIVVKNKNDEIIRKIAKVTLEVNSKHICSINFYVVNEDNKDIIDSFLNYNLSKRDCQVSIKEFKEKVMKLQEVIDVKEIDGYDSNVLVIVKNKSDELIRKIARIALEVNSKYDCPVNFYISTKYE